MPPRYKSSYKKQTLGGVKGAAYRQGVKDARASQISYKRSRYANRRTGGYVDLENKFIDFEIVDSATSTAWATHEDGTALCISATAIGDSESNRNGRVYHINSVHLKGFISKAAAESVTAPIDDRLWRVCVVLDTQSNETQLTATDVMDGGQTTDVLSFRNLQFTKRFKVLYDTGPRLLSPQNTNEGAVNLFANKLTIARSFSFNKQFKKPIKVICSGTTAVIGSITDNSIHVIAVSTGASALLSYQSRVRFTQ